MIVKSRQNIIELVSRHDYIHKFEFRLEDDKFVVDRDPSLVEKATLIKDAGKMWSFSYQDQLRLRRRFWKGLHFDPKNVLVAERDARSAQV